MTEKVEGQQANEKTEQTEQKEEAQYTPIQLKAIEQGWIPKEEFDGEADEFIDAAEFVRRGELFSKINSQNKKVQQLEQALHALKEHNSKIKQVEYDRALKSLKQAQRKAQIEGEHEQAFAIEDRIEEIERDRQRIEEDANDTPPGPSPEYTKWVEENSWYTNNEVMQEAADAIGRKLHARGTMSNEEILAEVTKRIKKEFEHKFRSPNTKKPNAVEGSSRNPGKGSDELVMTEQERDMMKKIVRTGVMTEAEYKAQLKATR